MARQIARRITAAGLSVFFDEWNEAETVGRSLHEELRGIYFRRSRHCIVLLSRRYFAGDWTMVEWNAILSRSESDKDFLTLVSVDGTRTRAEDNLETHYLTSLHSATRIALKALRRVNSDEALRVLRVMKFMCGFETGIITGCAILAPMFTPHLWHIHVIFIALVICLMLTVKAFYIAPTLISVCFVLLSGGFCLSALNANAFTAWTINLAFGPPTLILITMLLLLALKIRSNRRKANAEARNHPLRFLRKYPELIIVGAEGDRSLAKLCHFLRVFRLRHRVCTIPEDCNTAVRWPSAVNSSVLLVTSHCLESSLWNHEERFASFKQWITSSPNAVVAVTTDGALAPVVDHDIGYINCRALGPFRSALFIANAFSPSLVVSYFSRLRAVLRVRTFWSFCARTRHFYRAGI